jgi:lysine 2,3-aminomutase
MEELSESITTQQQLASRIDLHPGEGEPAAGSPPLRIPPVFMRCIEEEAEARHPVTAIRTQFVPTAHEQHVLSYESPDPLSEFEYSPLPRLIHRYPDRVLIIVTGRCAVYCRYCFRRRLYQPANTSSEGERSLPGVMTDAELGAAAEYIGNHPEIREVILSGGDPLTLPDDRLERVLESVTEAGKLRKQSVVLRIATRVPAALPSRITESLSGLLGQHAPLWIIFQCNHPAELTGEAVEALSRLTSRGIPVVSQTVLLRGVNDDADVLARLFQRLLSVSVKPYYLFQGDLASGTSHFRVPLPRAFKIVRDLRRRVSGLAMPVFAVDLPGGGGKKALHEDMKLVKEGNSFLFTGTDGQTYRYPDETYCPESRPLL